MDVLATTDGGATFTVAPLPVAPEPEVTQAEWDSLVAQVQANQQKASDDVKQLSDLVAAHETEDQSLEAADQAEDTKQSADIIDLANRIGSGPIGTNPDNDIILDTFAGTDDQKLDAAWVVAQGSSPKRAIRLSARPHTFTKSRTTFTGLRILGPNIGWQNPELSGGSLPQCSVTLNCGIGPASWLVGRSTTYDVTVAGIAFKSSNGMTEFYDHPISAGTSYATRLDTLAFYGFKHVLGRPDDPFAATLNTWAGDWTCVAVQDTQFSLRGSDNWFCPNSMNYGWQGANGGKYLMRFSNVSKSTVRNLYLTCRGGSRGILVEGPSSQQGGLDFSDCVVEGQNAGDPAMGALIVVKGGGVSFTNTRLNFGMARPSDYTDQLDTGMVMIQGGVCLITNVWVNRANGVTESVPVVQVSAGAARVANVIGMGGNWSGRPLVTRSGGTVSADSSVPPVP